jgi:hypothetical protein
MRIIPTPNAPYLLLPTAKIITLFNPRLVRAGARYPVSLLPNLIWKLNRTYLPRNLVF